MFGIDINDLGKIAKRELDEHKRVQNLILERQKSIYEHIKQIYERLDKIEKLLNKKYEYKYLEADHPGC